ncbi:MAG: manganese efflux pump MntP family protein [Oscillospiraceae bacterium]|nr:manganese efflux pump MntP family protein [Oscillospiraceae bacterium]
MSIIELLLISVGLAMDAFAVAVCKGLAWQRRSWGQAAIVGLYFGVFQGLMPVMGYLLGIRFADVIQAYDHWIAFILLAAIGVNMLRESRQTACPADSQPGGRADLSVKTMLPLAIATSIDALAVGISFAFLKVKIAAASLMIAAVTFALSMLGVLAGQTFGARFKSRAEQAGGIILILIGLKILLQHLGILPF